MKMKKLVLAPGTAVRMKNPKTCWQELGGTIIDVWPNYDHPEKSIVGLIFPRGGLVKEETAALAEDLIPFDEDSDNGTQGDES